MRREGEYLIVEAPETGRSFKIDTTSSPQLKYEMIRMYYLEDHPVDEIISIFGYSSRQSFYTALDSFNKKGIGALIPKSTGPQKSYRRTEKVEQRIIEIRFDDRTKDMYEIANILQEEGCKISARSVARTLSNYGITLKKNEKEALVNEFSLEEVGTTSENPFASSFTNQSQVQREKELEDNLIRHKGTCRQ